jgi:hypothetical protein
LGAFSGSVAFAREWRERRERRRMRADERVRMRNEAKKKLADVLAPLNRLEATSMEVVIRDADRDDNYPQTDDKFRVWRLSPWFKVELTKPWGDGISVWLENAQAVIGDGVVRIVDPNEHGEPVRIVGRIPYEVVAGVDPEGDTDYPMPQIFCHFDYNHAREPYRETVAYRYQGFKRWIALEGVRIVGRERSSLWRRWRLHRRQEIYEREYRRDHPEHPPTPPPTEDH